MQVLEELELMNASVLTQHGVILLRELAEIDPQARRDLKSVSLLLKSLTEEAKARVAERQSALTEDL